MSQAMSYQTPDVVDTQGDTTRNSIESSVEQSSSGKKTVLGRLKEKTKQGTSKIKNKLKPGATDGTSSSSSSEDESDAPTENAFSGITQPEYGRKLDSGDLTPRIEEDSLNRRNPDAISVEEFNTRTTKDFPPSHGEDSGSLSKQFEGLSTTDKPSSQVDNPDSSVTSDSVTPSTHNTLPTAGDTSVEEKSDPEGLLSDRKPSEQPKTWGQWVGEKVGLAKPSSTKISATSSDTSTTDTGKPSESTDTARADVEEKNEDATNSDLQKQTYTQKFTGAMYNAKDSLMTSTHPGDDDKALSQKVTETVGNLPATIKSTLGFGNKSTNDVATSPTTTPSLQTTTEDLASASPRSAGIMGRITESVNSVFGKKPSESTTDESIPASGGPSSETITPETESRT